MTARNTLPYLTTSLKKRLCKHPLGFFSLLFYCWMIGYQLWFEHSNPAPDEEDLKTYSIKIINTQKYSPHLYVELIDGTKRPMEYPTSEGIKSKAYSGLKIEDQDQSTGCTGFIRGTPVKSLIGDRFRIWHIECGKLKLTYNEARDNYTKDTASWLLVFQIIVLSTGLILVFFLEGILNERK